MPTTQDLITTIYAAFNQRDIDAVFASMADDISWPKASEGGRVTGKDEIRAYWTRQWAEFNPFVYPVELTEAAPGITEVKVHQVVRDLHGTVLFDGYVQHVYTIANGLVQRMDIPDADETAFQHAKSALTHR